MLLHLAASPRGTDSATRRISDAYIDARWESDPDLDVVTLDLFEVTLPRLAADSVVAKYSLLAGQQPAPGGQEWAVVEAVVEQFLAADEYLVTSPMWNFSIPYVLKQYIDTVVQPGRTFGYDEQRQPVGLVQGRRLTCVTSRGADYSAPPLDAYDQQEAYLAGIFGFIGVVDQAFVHAQPMDYGPDIREAAIASAVTEARALAATHAA